MNANPVTTSTAPLDNGVTSSNQDNSGLSHETKPDTDSNKTATVNDKPSHVNMKNKNNKNRNSKETKKVEKQSSVHYQQTQVGPIDDETYINTYNNMKPITSITLNAKNKKKYDARLSKELKKLEKKQTEIDRIVKIIERLRKYHMDDVYPSKLRREYLTKLMRIAPKHPKLKVFLPMKGDKYQQTSKSKVASNLVRNVKDVKQDTSVKVMAKYRNTMNAFKKRRENKKQLDNIAKQHAENIHKETIRKRIANKLNQNARNRQQRMNKLVLTDTNVKKLAVNAQ